MKGFFIFPILLILLFGTPAFADLAKGIEAGKRGDFTTALKELKPLAEQGDSSAQYFLGLMYLNGMGVTKDYKAAIKWSRLAAEQGYPEAQYNLGVMYSSGRGVTKDHRASFKWFRLAAEQGLAFAQHNLGMKYAYGQGVIQDYTRAHMWLNIAASQGVKSAVGSRDKMAKEMTPSQLEKAQDLARECVAKNYKGC